MYRAASLRVACDRCGELSPLEEMQLTGGGHRCWRCQLGDEVGAHERAIETAATQRKMRNFWLSNAAIAIIGPILFLLVMCLFAFALLSAG
jgi:hypothetical protein